ncbi:LysR family transcriptional regulator substrate-binding protein [bacterium BFN5]|nr:LysR family transcriptional regulator substrate-binding protein [bacterium BFN5]QJW49064.1 LysR family transcriptional regulator substrate-binding protein [bacterium BFN5]
MKRFVRDSWGIGFVPQVTVCQELTSGQLLALPWAGPSFNIHAQLLYHKDKWQSPALKAFIEVTLKTLKPGQSPTIPR